MMKLVLALALGVTAHGLTEREKMVEDINDTPGITWSVLYCMYM